MDRAGHWQSVYRDKAADSVSWYQPVAATSLDLIERLAPGRDAAIIDVGGGASRLVDGLLETGYRDISVLDIADNALAISRARLGERGEQVDWIVCDVIECQTERKYDLWHDRAVFHFLTEAADRRAYASVLERALKPGGWCIIATFALDGPERCSGLPVQRYDEKLLMAELGEFAELCDTRREIHLTPTGGTQEFAWFVLKRR
jgi:SAM-dependent methyltransferase